MYGTGGAFRVPKSNTVESTASDAIARITITVLVQIAPLSAPSRAPRARTTAKARRAVVASTASLQASSREDLTDPRRAASARVASRATKIVTFEYLVRNVAATSRPATPYCGHGRGNREIRWRQYTAAAKSSG